MLRPSTLSVVLPCYNESENIAALVERLIPVLEPLTEGRFEILFIDDGSRDGSPEIVRSLNRSDGRIRLVELSRNFGHQAALSAGLAEATGDAVVLMDADLQDPPELIPLFVARWREGSDVVYAVRRTRKEGWLKRSAYSVFYRSMRLLADIDIPLDAGDFCLMDRSVVDAILQMPERHRFLRGLRAWVGFRHTGVVYDRHARNAGAPKYTLRRLVRLALSGYLGFSTVPLRLATVLGLIVTGLGLLLLVWAVGARAFGLTAPRGWASAFAADLVLGGTQLLMLGVLSEYISRIYDEVRRRPLYVIRDRVGFATGGVSDQHGVFGTGVEERGATGAGLRLS